LHAMTSGFVSSGKKASAALLRKTLTMPSRAL
jgi:hypothetical protein